MQSLDKQACCTALTRKSDTIEYLDFNFLNEFIQQSYSCMAKSLAPFCNLKKLVLPRFSLNPTLPQYPSQLVPETVVDLEVTADTLEQYKYFARVIFWPMLYRYFCTILTNLKNESISCKVLIITP